MKPVAIGAVVAVAVIGAFALGALFVEEQQQGPAEEIGSAIDDAASRVGSAVESATNN
jgi:hypothetical protein